MATNDEAIKAGCDADMEGWNSQEERIVGIVTAYNLARFGGDAGRIIGELQDAVNEAEERANGRGARIAQLEAPFRALLEYAASVWFDESRATDEEHELMHRARAAIKQP